MGYYFVISQADGLYEIESLMAEREKIPNVKFEGDRFINPKTNKEAAIIGLLPADFKLSVFYNPEDRFLFKGEERNLLYDLSNSFVKYNGEEIKKSSIIQLTSWK